MGVIEKPKITWKDIPIGHFAYNTERQFDFIKISTNTLFNLDDNKIYHYLVIKNDNAKIFNLLDYEVW